MPETPATAPMSSNHTAENRCKNLVRCVTPISSSPHRETLSDEEDIPHMLKPYSEGEDTNELNDENDHSNDGDDYIELQLPKPITYRADLPQYWQLPHSNGYDIVNSSPVSSISNFSCHTSNSIDSGLRRNSNQKELCITAQYHHIMEFPSSPKATRKNNGVFQPKLKPRMDTSSFSFDHHHNISVIPQSPIKTLRKKSSKSRSPSPANSQESRGSSHVRKGSHESRSDYLPPPSPRRSSSSRTKKTSNHRRSVSLNQIQSSFSYTNMGVQQRGQRGTYYDECRLSPIRQIPKISSMKCSRITQYSPYQSRLIPPKPATINNTHRRAVSFPDQVLQNGYTTANFGNISPLTLQSDDPALFSLLETTQSSSNGRVYIPNDVDPSIYIPTMNPINAIRSASPIRMTRRDNNNNNTSSTTATELATTIETHYHSQSIINPKKLESQSRHYTKKHRRAKSGSGSFSSSEHKLASLLEEDVLQSDDFASSFAGDALDVTEQQSSDTLSKENGLKRMKHRKSSKNFSTSNRGKSSLNESFMDNGGNHRRDFLKNNKKYSDVRKEKRSKIKLNQRGEIDIKDDSWKGVNSDFGKATFDQTKRSKRSSDICIIQ